MAKYRITRGPLNDDELHAYVKTLWGIDIPRDAVCPGHVAPFTAFADAYFARAPVAIWVASRGFGGKTTLLSTLATTEMTALGAEITLLGGSGAQSERVHEEMDERWEAPLAPKHLLTKAVRTRTELSNGASCIALMASQRSVRGPHPQRLRLDEIDEMDQGILDASFGQPMYKNGIETNIVLSSTWQNPDGTVTNMLKRAKENGWPVYNWCYRESHNRGKGWLRMVDIERKKTEIPARMWETEYDLQEPSFEGRAIDTVSVDIMFDPALGTVEGKDGKSYIFQPYDETGDYVTTADWAKEKDWTVIQTWRTDDGNGLKDAAGNWTGQWRLVAFERCQRMPWPRMVAKMDDRIAQYGGRHSTAAHDANGIGNVVADLLSFKIRDENLRGDLRRRVLSEYVAAIENGRLKAPRIQAMWDEHKFATEDDLYGNGHLPDTMSAGALAWKQRGGGRLRGVPTGSTSASSIAAVRSEGRPSGLSWANS